MPDATEGTLELRVILQRPPAGVAFRVQRGATGKHELVAPLRETKDEIVCGMEVRVVRKDSGEMDFRGPFVHGKAGERFLYVCAGTSAGQMGSPWTRRMKVQLRDVPPALAERAMREGRPLSARFAGTANDGGPPAATCRPLDGWSLVD